MTDQQANSEVDRLPQHVAVIMDGNGRWAQARHMPRTAGHRAGAKAARTLIRECGNHGIRVLTLFAFSSENWRRPQQEVSMLMDLMLRTLRKEASELHQNEVRIRIVGDRSRLGDPLNRAIEQVEQLTAGNAGIELVVAVSYGGRWDIAGTCRRLAERVAAGEIQASDIDEAAVGGAMALADLPPPDLLIRTGGECRLSNFLLWQLAYAELFFSETLWPDFGADDLGRALAWFAGRQRRFGAVQPSLGRRERA